MATIVLLGTVVLMRNPRHRLHRSFFALSLSASLWILTNLVFAAVPNPDLQYDMALLSYGGAGLLGLFFLQYCLGLANVKWPNLLAIGSYVLGFAMTGFSVLPGAIAQSVVDNKILTNSVPLMLYGLYVFTYLITGIIVLLWRRAKSKGVERSKITIVLLGLVLAAIVGVALNLVLPILGNYEFVKLGPVATLILVATSTYAIVHHRLFDIKLAAVRTIAYAGALLTLSGVYYVLAYVLSVLVFNGQVTDSISVSPVNILLALVLAFLFQPIKQFFDRATNTIFYRDRYDSDTFFGELGHLLSSTTDLRGLLMRAAGEIAATFKAEHAFFFLYYRNGSTHHMSAGTRHHGALPVHDAHMLDHYVMSTDTRMIVTDTLDSEVDLYRMLVSHGIALVMPLRRDQEVIGYVCLGDSLSGRYNKRDMLVLSAIRDELVIAIQNALSLHEIRELNATLQQRINVATRELRSSNSQLKHLDEVKDEFISMASHQLRTPLTSVKGYISMVLEGDAGSVTQQQQKLLVEAFKSSERMVGLINDFLNVSRLQTGKFVMEKTAFDFHDLIKQEITDLELIARSHNIKIRRNITNHPLPVVADESKVRQVVMNFVDNAIYYSHPHSTIVINVEKVGSSLAMTVVDTGIGVPKDEQGHLFNKFFRAENARKQRPDGTGVGLYLARRVVSAHGGTIIFSSKEGKGSTFGFRLPLSAKPVPAAAPAPKEKQTTPV